MMTTRGIRLGSAALLLGLVVAGCGGSGDRPVNPSVYRGAWSGTWTGATSNDGGALVMTVYSDGSVDGTMGRSPNLSGTINGSIDANGNLTAVGNFGADGNFLISGSVIVTTDLIGSFRYKFLGNEYNGSFSCKPSGGG